MTPLQFQWDEAKATANLRKHGVGFEESITVFGDPQALTIFDEAHSDQEDRYVDIGRSASGRVLVVVYTERASRFVSSVAVGRLPLSGDSMNNKAPEQPGDDDEMRPEYDFSKGVRGKHHRAYQQGVQVIVHKTDGTTEVRDFVLPEGAIVLDPDVRAYFPDSETVNRTLRELIHLIPEQRLPSEMTG